MTGAPAHMASIVIETSYDVVFDYLCNPHVLEDWALGSTGGTLDEAGLISTRSRFDGAPVAILIEGDRPGGIVRFSVGTTSHDLVNRITAFVCSGETFGAGGTVTMVMLISVRDQAMSDERWRRMTTMHEAEVHLLKAKLEAI